MLVCFALLLVAALAGAYWQRDVQAGIDTNVVQVSGEVTRRAFPITGGKAYKVGYEYQGRRFEQTVTSLPPNVEPGSRVCLEINGMRPTHARGCNSLGGLPFFQLAVIIVGALLVLLLLLRIALGFRARRQPPPGEGRTRRRGRRHHAAG